MHKQVQFRGQKIKPGTKSELSLNSITKLTGNTTIILYKTLTKHVVSNKIVTGERSRTKLYKEIIATTGRLVQLTEALKTHIIHTYTTRDIMNNTNMAIL